jgi:hypothetical protein
VGLEGLNQTFFDLMSEAEAIPDVPRTWLEWGKVANSGPSESQII